MRTRRFLVRDTSGSFVLTAWMKATLNRNPVRVTSLTELDVEIRKLWIRGRGRVRVRVILIVSNCMILSQILELCLSKYKKLVASRHFSAVNFYFGSRRCQDVIFQFLDIKNNQNVQNFFILLTA